MSNNFGAIPLLKVTGLPGGRRETEAHKFARTHARTHGYTPQKCWLYLHLTLVSSANRALGSIWFNSLCHVFYRVCFKNSCVRWKHLVRNWKTNTSINCPPASMTAPIGKAYLKQRNEIVFLGQWHRFLTLVIYSSMPSSRLSFFSETPLWTKQFDS